MYQQLMPTAMSCLEDLASVPIIISKYERARVVGLRAHMLQRGVTADAPTKSINPLHTASSELSAGTLPISVRRRVGASSEFVLDVRDISIKPMSPPGVPPQLQEQIVQRCNRALTAEGL